MPWVDFTSSSRLEVLLKRYPFVVHIHFPAPGADLDETFQNTQSPKNPERGRNHRGRDEQHSDRFEPKFLRPQRRLDARREIETARSRYSSSQRRRGGWKTRSPRWEDHFFVGMRLFDFHDVVSSPRTALAMASIPVVVNFAQRPTQGFAGNDDPQFIATDGPETMRGQISALHELQNRHDILRHGRNDNARLGFVEEDLIEPPFACRLEIDRCA